MCALMLRFINVTPSSCRTMATFMEWSEAHDILLCREIRFKEPYQHRKGSSDRGKVWSEIAESLNGSAEPTFKVTQRSVRERYNLLQAKYKKKMAAEESSTGTSPVPTEVDILLEEITEKELAAEESRGCPGQSQRNQADKAAGSYAT